MYLHCTFLYTWVPSCPSDYREWLVTMYSVLGMKWCKLHCGPMWSGQQVSQGIAQSNTSLRIEEVFRYCIAVTCMY